MQVLKKIAANGCQRVTLTRFEFKTHVLVDNDIILLLDIYNFEWQPVTCQLCKVMKCELLVYGLVGEQRKLQASVEWQADIDTRKREEL